MYGPGLQPVQNSAACIEEEQRDHDSISRAMFFSKIHQCIVCIIVCLHVICVLDMLTKLDYSSALEYSIIRCYTHIEYYYYYSGATKYNMV